MAIESCASVSVTKCNLTDIPRIDIFTELLASYLYRLLDIYGWLVLAFLLRFVFQRRFIYGVYHSSRKVPTDVSLIEDYVTQNEQRSHSWSPLIEGAEKHIRWADGVGKKTKYAIVFIHGFSACRQEIHPVLDKIAEKFGWNTFYTRLSGHGGKDPTIKMQDCRTEALVEDLHEALKVGATLSEDGIVLIGTSTGGALASFGLTTELGRNIVRKAILIAPAFGFHLTSMNWFSKPYMFGDHWIRALIIRLKMGNLDSFEGQTEEQSYWWSTSYPSYAYIAVMDACGLANWSVTQDSMITAPILIIASPNDKIVDYEKMRKVWSNTSAKVEHFCPPYECKNGHCIVGASVSPSGVNPTIEKMSEFLSDMS